MFTHNFSFGKSAEYIPCKYQYCQYHQDNVNHNQNYNSKLIDPNINIAVSLKWTITGKVDDEAVGTVLVEGVKSKNQQAIKQANMKVPGISARLTNLLEFYTDTDFIAPADINAK